MWCALEPSGSYRDQAGDYLWLKKKMRKLWSRPLFSIMTMLAAMIGCNKGFSAVPWIRRFFVPALVQYDDRTKVLGLLSKHARPSRGWQPHQMLSVGRHLSSESLGKDLVLVNPKFSRVPVGTIPDFIDLKGLQTYEERTARLETLYQENSTVTDNADYTILHIPLP